MGFRDRHRLPDLGIGVGARPPHYAGIYENAEGIDWLEVISENYISRGGGPLHHLRKLRAMRPLIPHGVSMSIGGTQTLDFAYLDQVKELAAKIEAPWWSDHLCFTGAGGLDAHDLLPLPFRNDVAKHVADRIKRVQDHVGRPFILENVSSYLTYRESALSEWEFVLEVAERADCGLLLDCNNIYVSSKNHGFDPENYIDAIPADRIVQIHLAGHSSKGDYLLDTHSCPVIDEVFSLYRRVIKRTGSVSTLIEWDEDLPTWDALRAEAGRARIHRDEALR